MLYRKVEKDILSWIKTGKKALLIYGVRQAGKTYVIRKCLDEAECNYVEFNLIQQPEVLEILENTSKAEDIILKLSLYSNKKLIPGETYIFWMKYKCVKNL